MSVRAFATVQQLPETSSAGAVTQNVRFPKIGWKMAGDDGQGKRFDGANGGEVLESGQSDFNG
jgi:hypothetical protein